jgi:hypothetical protein
MHRVLNSACRQSFIHRSDMGRTSPIPARRTSWTLLGLTTRPERTWVVCFGPTGPGDTLAPTFSQFGETICTTSEQLLFHLHINLETKTCTYSHENGYARLTYHCPSLWQALQRHTTTQSPPGIDINTCTRLWTWLVISRSHHWLTTSAEKRSSACRAVCM